MRSLSSLPVLSELPPGTVVERGASGVLAMAEEDADALRSAGWVADWGPDATVADLVGRIPLRQLRRGDRVYVVRAFVHGGLARSLTGKRFLDAERPFREMCVSHRLRELGIRTPRVAAARARVASLLGSYLDLVTVKVEGLQSLTSVLQGDFEPRILRRAAHAFGELVREFHRHGFLHADLTTENTLVETATLDSDEPVLWTLDLDKSEFRDELSDRDRRDNLRRLLRCIERRDRDGVATRTLRARFFRGYDPTGRRWKDDWRAIAGAVRRNRWAHVTGWLLERAAAGDSASRREKGLGQERPSDASG